MSEYLRDVRLRKERPINSHFGGVAHGPGDLTFAVMVKVFGAERIETVSGGHKDKTSIHGQTRWMQREVYTYSSS